MNDNNTPIDLNIDPDLISPTTVSPQATIPTPVIHDTEIIDITPTDSPTPMTDEASLKSAPETIDITPSTPTTIPTPTELPPIVPEVEIAPTAPTMDSNIAAITTTTTTTTTTPPLAVSQSIAASPAASPIVTGESITTQNPIPIATVEEIAPIITKSPLYEDPDLVKIIR